MDCYLLRLLVTSSSGALLRYFFSIYVYKFLTILGFWFCAVFFFSELGIVDYLQHKVRLGKYKRDSESVQREGENLQAVWSPDTKLIAVVVSFHLNPSLILVIYIVQFNWLAIHCYSYNCYTVVHYVLINALCDVIILVVMAFRI